MILQDSSAHQHKEILLRVRQIIISLGPVLITISFGLAEGYSAILLPQLEEDSEWNIDIEMSSWIASIITLPMPIGCLLGGWLMELIGRKMLHLVICIPNLLGWLLIVFCGHNVAMLLAGRFIIGICIGVLSPVSMVYVAETSDPIFRGFLMPCISLAMNLGIALSHTMGTYLEWKLVAMVSCMYPISSFILLLFVPESPTFLMKKGKIERAKESFFWFRGSSEAAKTEIDIIISREEEEKNLPKKTVMEYLEVFKKPEFYKPLLIIVVFFSTMQWSGNNPVAFYTVNILRDVLGDSSVSAYTSMLIMDGVRVIAAILGCFGQKYMKRRKLMTLSGVGTLVSLLALSIYLFLTNNNFAVSNIDISWIPLTAFISYIFFLNVGLLPLPYSMIGELFAQASRGLGSGIVTSFNMILMFILVKLTPWLFAELHTEGVFLLFATCCFLGVGALLILLPETKDKPLYEIENHFRR